MKKYLKQDELAKEFSVTNHTIWRWRKDGLPFIKKGNLVVYNMNDVYKWLHENSES